MIFTHLCVQLMYLYFTVSVVIDLLEKIFYFLLCDFSMDVSNELGKFVIGHLLIIFEV
jgi:hypothetical protein